MGTIADKLAYLAGTKTAIKNSLKAIGVSVEDTDTFRSYSDKITGLKYIKPYDWISLPSMVNGDQKVALLFAVYGKSGLDYYNKAVFTMTTSTGNYRVDWGDGTTTDYASGTQAEHSYAYSSIAAAVNNEGYKQVLITVTPLTGNFLTCNFTNKPTEYKTAMTYMSNIVAVKVASNTMTSLVFGASGSDVTINPLLEYFEFVGTCVLSTYAYMFENCYALQAVIGLTSTAATSATYMFYGCGSLRFGPTITTSNVTIFDYMFYGCYAMTQVPSYNTTKMTNCLSMFKYCSSLQKVGTLVMTSASAQLGMYSYCYSIKEINIDMTLVSNNGFSCIGSSANWMSLGSLNITNMSSAITNVDVSVSQLNRDALVSLFNSLCNRTSLAAGTITITNCLGASALTAADRLIATNKNWTITG